MDLQLDGKKVLVTGSSRGLGYALARTLALEAAIVTINSRRRQNADSAAIKISQESSQAVHTVIGDVGEVDTPTKLVDQAAKLMSGLDILVTNAGGPPAGGFESFNETDWAQAVNLSLLSHVRLIRAALPYLRQSNAASVLTITSYSVKQPIPNLVLSNSIRAATVGLTKTLALELGGEGIRFNSILPGWTQTERVTELMAQRAKVSGRSVEEEVQAQSQASPLSRMATPQEFANAAAFLISPAASYLTGVMLSVDGGMYKGTL